MCVCVPRNECVRVCVCVTGCVCVCVCHCIFLFNASTSLLSLSLCEPPDSRLNLPQLIMGHTHTHTHTHTNTHTHTHTHTHSLPCANFLLQLLQSSKDQMEQIGTGCIQWCL